MQRAKRVAATRNDCVRIERSRLARLSPHYSAGNEQQMLPSRRVYRVYRVEFNWLTSLPPGIFAFVERCLSCIFGEELRRTRIMG